MRPTFLKLHNFMSYEHAKIDLADIDLAVIVGSNGAGKSTLLQAMTYVLWGQVRTASHNNVVTRGKSSCMVRMDFESGGQQYTAIRRRKLSGKGSSDLELAIQSNGELQPLTRSTIKETQGLINEIVGDFELFSSSSLLQQGDADRFSSARPGERKELLAKYLGLGWLQEVEQRARKHSRALEQGIGYSQATLRAKEGEIGQMPAIDVDALTTARHEAENTVHGLALSLDTLEEDLAQLLGLQTELDGLRAKHDSISERTAELQEDIKDLEAELPELEEWSDRQEEIQDQYEVTSLAMETRNDLANDAKRHHELTAFIEHASQKQPDKELEKEQAALSDHLQTRDVIEGYIAEAQRLIDLQQSEMEDMANAHMKAAEKLVALETNYKQKQDSHNKLRGAETCPTCNQSIEDPARLLIKLQTEMEALETLIWQLRTDKSELSASVQACQQRIVELGRDMEQSRAKLRQAETNIATCQSSISSLDVQVNELAAAKIQLEDLDFDEEAYTAICKLANQAVPAAELHQKMLDAVKRTAEVRGQIESKWETLHKAFNIRSDLAADIGDVEYKLIACEERATLERDITKCKADLAEASDRAAALSTDLALAKENDARQKRLEEEIAQAESDIGLALQKKDMADLLVAASCKTGAQALLIEAALPQIENDANEYLENMAPSMKILLNTQRLTLAGSASETLDIVVYADGQEAPIETLSGGERFRADLAIRLAIGKMLARRAGSGVEMLAIDEGFGSQDASGQEVIVNTILSLMDLFGLVLVISHVRSVANALGVSGTTIEATKIGGRSQLEIA